MAKDTSIWSYRVKPYILIFCMVSALRRCVIFNSKLHICVLRPCKVVKA